MNHTALRLDDEKQALARTAGRGSLRLAVTSNGCLADLGRRYQLTPAELAVTELVAEARPLKAVAACLGIKVNTVRAHLRSIFDKTGARRQAELVRLVLAGS